MTVQLPQQVQFALDTLEQNGFEAYVVGGCVRDSLRGLKPHDWDITTSATPEQMKTVFAQCALLDIGAAHGTVTLLRDNMPLEITTFRTEGGYSDGRHPDFVRFSNRLEDDLSRRDFTVNAMAYHPKSGLIDPFGGKADLENGILRCVGTPQKRLSEDALRVLRALRFAATVPLTVHPETARALSECANGLTHISPERIEQELTKLLCGVKADCLLREFSSVIFTVIPELQPMRGFNQKNRHHSMDVWEHTLSALSVAPSDPCVRWALLLHDCGKPYTFTLDEAGEGHFYGHAEHSARIADTVSRRLRFSNERREALVALVRHHDIPLTPTKKAVRRMLSRFGEALWEQLLQVKQADRLACHPDYRDDATELLAQLRCLTKEILCADECFSLSHLAVNGHDLEAAGFPVGPPMGRLLQRLLDAVMNEECENTREALLRFADTL